MTAVTGPFVRSPAEPARPVPEDLSALRFVAPDAVPPGAVVVAVVIADLPDPGATGVEPVPPSPARLVALPGADDGTDEVRPGLVHDRWGRRVLVDGQELHLTRREYELFAHLVAHPGRVFTRTQLLRAVWDLDEVGYAPARTVDVHVARLRRKIGVHAETLHSVRGVGYRWNGGA